MLRRLSPWLDHSDFATVPISAAFVGSLCDATVPAFLAMAAGFASWTLVEYAAHRALHSRSFPRLRAFHMKHHQRPLDASGGTLYSSAIIASFVIASIARPSVAPALLGVFVGYYAFITLHYVEHHASGLLAFSPLRRIAEHHWRHHHDRPRGRFGVTTSLWDRLLGTM